MATKPRLFILDANASLHRAWHALPPLTSPDGTIVNAVYGVMMTVMKLIQDYKPECFVACWDTKAPTFRHEAYTEYKAGREKQEDALYEQIPILHEGLSYLGVDSLSRDGFEADDLIGTIAYHAKSTGWDVTIITGDRDALQLVQPGISVLAFKKGVTETIVYDEAEIQRQYGLTPQQFLEYKAMRGDPSDNIPGIKGIGEKGATELLQRYQNLSGILTAAHDSKSEMTPSLRKKLLDGEKDLPAIMDLVTIKTDVPLDWRPGAHQHDLEQDQRLKEFLLRMGFKSLIAKMEGGKSLPSTNVLPANKTIEAKSIQQTGQVFRDIVVATEEKVSSVFLAMRKEKEVVLAIAGNPAQPSLDGMDGLVIGVGDVLALFPSSLLKKSPSVKLTLSEILADPLIEKVAHDAKTFMREAKAWQFEIRGWSFDTMLAAYLLGAGERNFDLPSLALRYADVTIAEESAGLRKAESVCRLAVVLREKLEAEGQTTVLSRFEMPLIPVLFEMEEHGILIDAEYLAVLADRMRKERQELQAKMIKAAGRDFNPASPMQLAEILFDVLELPTTGIRRGKTGISTAASELEKLRGSHPIIEMIEDHRELSKLLSTYVETLPLLADKNGRVHTTFNQAVTATGRLSSSEPNLQNIPTRTELGRQIRRAFVAEKGFTLVSCDYSQIELRLVATLAKDAKMLDAFRRNADIHTETAAAIWHIKPEDVTKDQRRAAKAVNFGIIYGQGSFGLAESAGIPVEEAKGFIDAYFEYYRGIKTYMDETKDRARELGYVETLFGRRRPLPEIHAHMHQVRAAAERMAINMPVQGTAADVMKLAMIAVSQKLPTFSKKTRLLLQVHDELVLEVPEDEVENVTKHVKEIMENIEDVGVPILVETKSGASWAEME
ncbi:MAG: DNA polymerase I [Patescibacteria group bacterium]